MLARSSTRLVSFTHACNVKLRAAVHYCHSLSIIYSLTMPSMGVLHVQIAGNKIRSEACSSFEKHAIIRRRDTCGTIIRIAKEFYSSNKRTRIYIIREMLLFTISLCDATYLVSLIRTLIRRFLFRGADRHYIRFLIFYFQLPMFALSRRWCWIIYRCTKGDIG